MSRTPGRKIEEPDNDNEVLAVEELELREIGQTLVELGEQLCRVGALTKGKYLTTPERGRVYVDDNGHELSEIEVMEMVAEVRSSMSQTLTGLRKFRRGYDYWERVIAEFALAKMDYTQRDTAKLLGVGVSTINRWAQNPLKVQEYR